MAQKTLNLSGLLSLQMNEAGFVTGSVLVDGRSLDTLIMEGMGLKDEDLCWKGIGIAQLGPATIEITLRDNNDGDLC